MGIIKKFDEYINESAWADVQAQASGEEVKKEYIPAFNWSIEIHIDTIASIWSGGDYMEDLSVDDRKAAREVFKGIKDKIKADKEELKEHDMVASFADRSMITVSGVNEKNLIYVAKKLIEWLEDVNTLYVDDIEKVLPYAEMEDELEFEYEGVWNEFEEYLYKHLEH